MEETEKKLDETIKKRKEKVVKIINEKINWIYYLIILIIAFVAFKIRTLNVPMLKDVTTGNWTLGPDLDPFLFLRWARYIVEHGSLMAWDMMRYVPLGYNTSKEYPLITYLIAWFHKFLSSLPNFFTSLLPGNPQEITVTYSALLLPAVLFFFTVIAFFFLVREVFKEFVGEKKANIIGIIASIFLSILPVLLPRTIAGIPEKESAAFLFMFLAFYFFICAWKSNKINKQLIFALLAGLATGAMGLTWGGYGYIFLVLSITLTLSFLLGQFNRNKLYIIGTWVIVAFTLLLSFTNRYTLESLLVSITTGVSLLVLGAGIINEIILKTRLKEVYYSSSLKKIPRELFSFLGIVVLGIVGGTLIRGVGFLGGVIKGILNNLIKPATSRLIQTVAENRQPYFGEWTRNFGPEQIKILGNVVNTPSILFWLFMIGSVYLVYNLLKNFKLKERVVISGSYFFFLISLVYSRYSPGSYFDGTNFQSLLFYGLGFLILGISLGYYYFKYYKSEERFKLKKIDFGALFVFSFFFFGVVSARGAIRLVMMLVPPVSMILGYFIVSITSRAFEEKNETKKNIFIVLSIIIVILSLIGGIYYYQGTIESAKVYAPSSYTNQWQKAMGWVRENTNENAVFGHWWDYGYWLQSIGERATVLDGGNSISYWNHLMGREVLTSPNDKTALEFLYAHNTSHYLIDSTDIGKYSAYSTIGSDISYDRQSYIPTIRMEDRSTKETNEGFIYVYPTQIGLDEDIIWEENGSRKIFAQENSGIGAIIIEEKNGELQQPRAIFINNGQQIEIPLKYLYYNNLKEFENGLDAGIFLMDELQSQNGGVVQKKMGAGFYLSPRIVNSFLTRKYLFEEERNFELIHSQPNLIVESIRSQGMEIDDFIYYQGNFYGPIKIWKINYPQDIEFKQEYLETHYPDELKYS
jgi:asparagine N-glycosylation enzyme membrane subunit Stt3